MRRTGRLSPSSWGRSDPVQLGSLSWQILEILFTVYIIIYIYYNSFTWYLFLVLFAIGQGQCFFYRFKRAACRLMQFETVLSWTEHTIRTHAHTYTHCWWHQIWTITVPEILWESISAWRQAKLRWDWCQTLLRDDLWHGNNKWHKCKMFLENFKNNNL